jgi:hypothetical protein
VSHCPACNGPRREHPSVTIRALEGHEVALTVCACGAMIRGGRVIARLETEGSTVTIRAVGMQPKHPAAPPCKRCPPR